MIDEAIRRIVNEAVGESVGTYHLFFNMILKELKELKEVQTKSEQLRFLLPEEVEERLKVSRPTLNKLIKAGNFKTSISSGGRIKILESSVNEYIAKEAGL